MVVQLAEGKSPDCRAGSYKVVESPVLSSSAKGPDRAQESLGRSEAGEIAIGIAETGQPPPSYQVAFSRGNSLSGHFFSQKLTLPPLSSRKTAKSRYNFLVPCECCVGQYGVRRRGDSLADTAPDSGVFNCTANLGVQPDWVLRKSDARLHILDRQRTVVVFASENCDFSKTDF